MGRLWAGWLLGIVTLAVIAWIIPYSGIIDMSATGSQGVLDWAGQQALESSLAIRAPDAAAIAEASEAVPAQGFAHYRDSCVICHGAPGVDPMPFVTGMQPHPPDLWSDELQEEMSNGELFRLIKGGVRMSGMPAFANKHSDQQIWSIVAFLRHMKDISEEQRAQLDRVVHAVEASGTEEPGSTPSPSG